MRPHARPADTEVKLVVSDDDGVEATLLSAGAEVRMRTVHFVGALG